MSTRTKALSNPSYVVTLDAFEFQEAVRFARYGMSTEETRYYLRNIYLDLHTDGLKVRATDGHRLHQVSLKHGLDLSEGARLAISPDQAKAICALKKKDLKGGKCRISFALRQISIVRNESPVLEVTTSHEVCEIDLDRVQPWKPDLYWQFWSEDMRDFLECASGTYRPVKLQGSIDDKAVHLTSSLQHGKGQRAFTTVSGKINEADLSKPFFVGFNSTYLLDAMKAFGRNAHISLQSNDYIESGPSVFIDGRRSVVIMPMRV